MREGDFIVAIGDRDVKWSPHDEVVKLIKASGDTLSLKLVTPMDRNYLKVSKIYNIVKTIIHKCNDTCFFNRQITVQVLKTLDRIKVPFRLLPLRQVMVPLVG